MPLPSDPFNPRTGVFAENIRAPGNDDLTELTESLRVHGWLEELPAIKDENGVTLVGHRRLKVASTLGVTPVIKTITLGSGDAADAKRVRLAIASNIGGKPLTAKDRQRIAQHLYGSKQWTMQRIAEALNVSAMQISRDLGNFNATLNSNPHPKSATNPKGAGRPKGTPKPRPPRPTTPTPRQQESIDAVERHGGEQAKGAFVKAGRDLGVDPSTVAANIKNAHRRMGLLINEADIEIDVSELPRTHQEKLAVMERRLQRETDARFEARVREEVTRRLAERDEEDILLLEQANELIRSTEGRRRPPFTPQEYFAILRACHPDTGSTPENRVAAFIVVRRKKLILCDEGPIARRSAQAPMPRTVEELRAARQQKNGARA